MDVIFILLTVSLVIAGGFLAAFIWAVLSGQFDDTTTPAMRLLDDDSAPGSVRGKNKEQNAV